MDALTPFLGRWGLLYNALHYYDIDKNARKFAFQQIYFGCLSKFYTKIPDPKNGVFVILHSKIKTKHFEFSDFRTSGSSGGEQWSRLVSATVIICA